MESTERRCFSYYSERPGKRALGYFDFIYWDENEKRKSVLAYLGKTKIKAGKKMKTSDVVFSRKLMSSSDAPLVKLRFYTMIAGRFICSRRKEEEKFQRRLRRKRLREKENEKKKAPLPRKQEEENKSSSRIPPCHLRKCCSALLLRHSYLIRVRAKTVRIYS